MLRFRLFLWFSIAFSAALAGQTDTLRLLFAGDIMGHGPMIEAARQPGGGHDYRPFFEAVAPVLQRADMAIGNLELTLPGAPPYQGYPMFRSPDALADALKEAGFDLLVTANNHSNDGGLAGVEHTIDWLRELGFWQTGTFKSLEERDIFYPLIVYAGAFKLAILNATYGTNGIPDHRPSMANLLDTAQMRRDFQIAKAMAPDFVIVVPHWGLEYQLEPNAEQRALARFFVENGADLIVGAHPHVVQPVEKIEFSMPDGGQKSVAVAWSLGNFISNQKQPNTEGGILFEAVLVKDRSTGAVSLDDFGIEPVYRAIVKRAARTVFLAVPESRLDAAGLSPTEAAKAQKFFAAARRRLKK